MANPTRPAPLLDEVLAHWNANRWPLVDLTSLRMEGEAQGDEDDDDDDDGGSGRASGGGNANGNADDVEAMKRALKKANKEAEQTRLKLKEYEDRDKSETEKLSERNRELESTLTTAEQRAMRLEIALDKGIPKTLAVRLQGDTREEMEKDADELLKTLGGNGQRKTPSFDGGTKDKAHEATAGSFLAEALRKS